MLAMAQRMGGWKSASTELGEQSATTHLAFQMPEWLVDNSLDSKEMVLAQSKDTAIIFHYFPSGASIVARDYIGVGTGPIFLDQLYCSESDQVLQSCRRGANPIGLTECDHTQDVQIMCKGLLKFVIILSQSCMSM